MKVTVLKSTVETALAPILKMVSGAKPPIDFHPTLTFQSGRQSLSVGCTLPDQQLAVDLPDAAFDERNASFDVSLEMFRRLTAAVKGTTLSIEQDAAHVTLSCDGQFIGQLVPMTSRNDRKFQIPRDAESTVLPTSFANFLLQAFTCTGDVKDRLALSGVNVSSRGIAGTDGHQLFHLPLPLQLKDDVTLPPSKVYAALKSLRWTSLAHWRTAANERMFGISGDGFRFAAKALDAYYPQFWQVIPAQDMCDVKVTLTTESAQSLQKFLAAKTDGATAQLTVHPDRIEILETSDKDLTQRTGVFEARCFCPNNPPHSVHFNTCFLKQFLKMGFLSLSFPSKASGPLVSSSGVGTYVFMPIGKPPEASEPAAATASPVPETRPAAVPAASQTVPTPRNQPEKEKPAMTPAIPVTANPSPAVASPVQTNPLDETLASIASMREQLSNLETRLLEAGRKLKSALIEQRQKERLYAEALRKLDRIRLAV